MHNLRAWRSTTGRPPTETSAISMLQVARFAQRCVIALVSGGAHTAADMIGNLVGRMTA